MSTAGNHPDESMTPAIPLTTGPHHAAVLTTSLTSLAVEAKDTAQKLLDENDLYLAAACLECADHYCSLAAILVDRIEAELPETLEVLTTQILTILEEITQIYADTTDAASPYPLSDEQVTVYAAHQQAFLNLNKVKRLSDTLNSRGEYDHDEWVPHMRDAYASTLDYLAHQGPFHDNSPDEYPSRPELNGQADQARSETIQIFEEAMKKYQSQIPVKLSPWASTLHDLEQNPQGRTTMSPQVGLHVEGSSHEELKSIAIRERDNAPIYFDEDGEESQDRPEDLSHALPPSASILPYISFIYEGVKHIKTLFEPYPQGFPKELAQQYGDLAYRNLLMKSVSWDTTIIFAPWCSRLAQTALMAADLELHDLPPNALKSLIKKASSSLALPRGATVRIAQAIVQGNSNVGDLLCLDPEGKWRRTVTKKQALAIIHTARGQGMDPYALVDIAKAMGYHPTDLNIVDPVTDDPTVASAVNNLTSKYGFPKSAINRIIPVLWR